MWEDPYATYMGQPIWDTNIGSILNPICVPYILFAGYTYINTEKFYLTNTHYYYGSIIAPQVLKISEILDKTFSVHGPYFYTGSIWS